MAKYTVELKTIVDSGFNVFDFPYEFYDAEKKEDFEKKFILHFKYREICCETVGRWQDFVQDKFNTVLPFYNMLFRTALIDYEKTINYSLTETLTRNANKTDNVTGNTAQNGTTSDTTTTSNNLTRSADVIATGEKTNTLNSTSDHEEDTTDTKDETITEKSTNDKSSTTDVDNIKVESDTPNNLLSVANIKTNVYASKADREDNLIKVTDKEAITADKTGKITDTNNKTAQDKVNATNKDTSTDTHNEDVSETNNGTTQSNGSFGNTANSSQNAVGTENENYTKVLRGSYGVITESDMLQKHINLQQTLSTILNKFFDECDDLFMQVY
jgi:hypothetical protein